MTGTLTDSQHTLTLFDVLVSICSLLSPGSLGCTGTGSTIVNHVGSSTSHKQGYNMASAMPADSSENFQPSQTNDGPEPATVARDRSLQTTRGKYSRRGTCDTTKVSSQDRMNEFPNQHLSKNPNLNCMGHTSQLRGMPLSTLRMRTAISPVQWQ